MRVLYQHRTQATCAEGEHIRGVVAAFRSLGHQVELVEPPAVHCEIAAVETPKTNLPRRFGVRDILEWVAEHLPEVFFELLELGYNIWEVPRLLWRMQRFRPQLLYARYSLFTVAPALTARLRRIPLVLEINDASFIERSRPLVMGWLARRIERFIFRCATLCVTISHQFAEMACRNCRIDPKRILVLPNAVTPERFVPASRACASEAVVLGTVGAFVAWHGLDFLVDAVARLRAANPGLKVLFVGDGPIRAAVEAQARQYGLEDVIEFTGFISPSRVPEFLQKMDICVIPDSNSHGSPMKLFEYMAMAKATISPRYSPIEEVIEHGKTGMLFAPRNLEDFCRQAEILLGDEGLRRRLGRRAREVVLEKHTWEANVRGILRALLPTEHFKDNCDLNSRWSRSHSR